MGDLDDLYGRLQEPPPGVPISVSVTIPKEDCCAIGLVDVSGNLLPGIVEKLKAIEKELLSNTKHPLVEEIKKNLTDLKDKAEKRGAASAKILEGMIIILNEKGVDGIREYLTGEDRANKAQMLIFGGSRYFNFEVWKKEFYLALRQSGMERSKTIQEMLKDEEEVVLSVNECIKIGLFVFPVKMESANKKTPSVEIGRNVYTKLGFGGAKKESSALSIPGGKESSDQLVVTSNIETLKKFRDKTCSTLSGLPAGNVLLTMTVKGKIGYIGKLCLGASSPLSEGIISFPVIWTHDNRLLLPSQKSPALKGLSPEGWNRLAESITLFNNPRMKDDSSILQEAVISGNLLTLEAFYKKELSTRSTGGTVKVFVRVRDGFIVKLASLGTPSYDTRTKEGEVSFLLEFDREKQNLLTTDVFSGMDPKIRNRLVNSFVQFNKKTKK